MMRRRDFSLAGVAVGTSWALPSISAAPPKPDQLTDANGDLTAEEALEELMEGNRRFRSGEAKHPRMSDEWRERLTKGQRPMATILACSDSRVPLELLFDQGFGDLFSIRVAGNVVTPQGVGSMEYAQHHLRTKLYIVLGHEGCGAVTAAMLPKADRDQEPKGVRELLGMVQVGVNDNGATAKVRLEQAVEANVLNSARKIMQLDPRTEGFQLKKTELLVAAVYELSTGVVRIIDKFR